MTTFHYQQQGQPVAVQIEPNADGYQVTIGDKTYNVVTHQQAPNRIAFSVNGDYKQIYLSPGAVPDQRQIWFAGEQWSIDKVDPQRKNRRANSSAESGALTASMPGQVQEILIEAGMAVKQGDTLLVLEAMKMETRLSAPHDGIVDSVGCTVGDVVARGQTLVVLT